jgi:hypothetical protein
MTRSGIADRSEYQTKQFLLNFRSILCSVTIHKVMRAQAIHFGGQAHGPRELDKSLFPRTKALPS